MKAPVDLQLICDDLKVCGRREMGILIKLRHKYKNICSDKAKAVADKDKAEKEAAKEPEDEDDRIDRELEETMKRMEREKKKRDKKDKVLADKSELRKKMSVIATTMLDNDEDLTMSRKLWDDIRKKGFEQAGEKSEGEESSEESKGSDDDSDMAGDDKTGAESSDEEVDEKALAVEAMAEQMEMNLNSKKEYQMSVDRNQAGKEFKKKALIEQQRLKLEDLAEKEALDNAGLLESDLDDSELSDDGRAYKLAEREDNKKEAEAGQEMVAGKDNESSGESDDEE